MIKTGYLLHVYDLGAEGWEGTVWGEPSKDRLGSGTKLLECLLSEPASQPVVVIVYSGASLKDGLTEGAYTKQFLLQHLGELREFPRLARLVDALSPVEYETFVRRVKDIVLGPTIANTLAEVTHGAAYFASEGVTQVVQVAAATHAPRCMKSQVAVRASGGIPTSQQWFLATGEVCFVGTAPEDVVVIEPPHRTDDPMRLVQPTLSQAIRPYFGLSAAKKQQLIAKITQEMSNMSDTIDKS